jgi:hypothetical protein
MKNEQQTSLVRFIIMNLVIFYPIIVRDRTCWASHKAFAQGYTTQRNATTSIASVSEVQEQNVLMWTPYKNNLHM